MRNVDGEDDRYLPSCIRGLTVGMSRLESVEDNLDVLISPNSHLDYVKKYWDYDFNQDKLRRKNERMIL